MPQIIKAITQIIILFLISLCTNQIADYFNLRIPGTVLGIIVVFFLLETKLIRLEWIETGANWLVSNIMLFLIPSAVGVIQYKTMLSENGLSLIAVIVISSVVVMVFTGLFAQNIQSNKEKEKNT
ncbi:CidA/LrgA family holin-like protein [Desulfitobacterium sp.]|uniref:CidA/LrgA family holin-like protein n=1 Tax=Desulfitobacterium sp. TaxID=49981 RepID=UPI002B20CE33|nr:CidA/LrgA family holin-like protein [Desulfitobacterium sp.]MEA4900933.1 CidA/LrgA family holin-like protein [Desulfitobacterium sp.]